MAGPILALDQSLSRTGFALWSSGQDLISGSWPLASRTALRAQAYRELWGKLSSVHANCPLAEIVHERPTFGAANQGEAQLLAACGMIGVIELFAVSRGIKVSSHAVQSWRSSWFLKHEAKAIRAKPEKLRDWKGAALRRARQFGFDPASHDEAEAIAILDHHMLTNTIMPQWRRDHYALDSLV